MAIEKAFWLVWREGSMVSRLQHETGEQARAEADRLAAVNPGVKFHVLRTWGYAQFPPAVMSPPHWHILTERGGPRFDPRVDGVLPGYQGDPADDEITF